VVTPGAVLRHFHAAFPRWPNATTSGVSGIEGPDYARAVAADLPEPRADELDLPGGPLHVAFAGGRRQQVRLGTILFTEGDVSNRVILLLSGRVKVSSISAGGHETVLGFRGAGDVLGELSAIDGEEHLATVTVVEAGEALVVPAQRFLAALAEQPGLALVVLRSIVGRLRDADRKRAEFTGLDVVGRVAQRLVELAERYGEASGDAIRIGIPISQREIAGWVGSSREAVNKAFGQMERRGLIAAERRHIVVLDLDGLRGRAR
jgi:CRP/FNR family cyclic AMP-dependent transcriptional regulator